MKKTQFGERLKVIRNQTGITQAELAKAAGLNPLHVSHFECGRRLPSLDNFRAILKALDKLGYDIGGYCLYLLDLES